MTEIVALNRKQGIALTDEGDVCHVTEWQDSDGDPCDEPEAIVAIAEGPNFWVVLYLPDFTDEAAIN